MKLNPEEISLIRQLLKEQEEGKKALLDGLLYTERPVSMEEFIRGENYLNRQDVWPRVMTICKYIDDPRIRRAILYFGKGSGKTTVMATLLARGSYIFGCYREPRAVFGIGEDSVVAMLNMSTSRDQAHLAVFGELKSMLTRSKWFRNRCEVLNNKIRFEGNYYAICGHSGTVAWEGLNVFYGVVDEVNKLRDSKGKMVGQNIYELLVSQAETRFPGNYKVIAASSSGEGPRFLDRELAAMKTRGAKKLTWEQVQAMEM